MKKLVMLLVAASAIFAAEPQKGTICFGTECSATTGATFEVKPADVERRFVWTSGDGATVVLGTLAPKATTIDLQSKDSQNVTLTLRGVARSGWPSETRFAVLQGRDRGWRWTVPAKLAGNAMTVRLPRGSYLMEIAAEHHKGDRLPLKIADTDVALKEITLAPLPVITGRVVTMKKDEQVPVAGAQLARAEGKGLTTTNEQGLFHAEVSEPLPKEMVVMASGFATRVVPLNIVSGETDLGTIKLGSGVKLTVHLDRAESVKSKTLRLQLFEKSRTQWENTSITRRDVKPADDDLVFPDLGEGEYYVTLSGDGSLEHLTTSIEVKSEDVTTTIHVQPFQLAGNVHLGSDPLTEGSVGIHDRFHTWTAEAPIDGEGHFGGTMWQRGDVGAWVSSKQFGSLPSDDVAELTGDPAPWDITFKRRLITGRVFDEETKQPIAHARLHLQVEAKETPVPGHSMMSRLYTGVQVADDGSYTIVAMHDGIYDLTAEAPDHITTKQTVEVTEHDESKTADLPMSRGVEQIIEAVWPNGEPVSNAQVIEGLSRDGHNPEWYSATDAAGKLKLRVRPDDTRTLFIVPHSGSFAVIHVVRPGVDPKPIHVVVPPPAGSLAVTLVDAAKKPSRGVMLMRFDGEWVPFSVIERLQVVPLSPAWRYVNLPAGAYELWGVSGLQSTFSPPPAEPVRVGLTAGEQAVEIVVAK